MDKLKSPCIMLMDGTDLAEKPVMIFLIGSKVVLEEYDVFMDGGLWEGSRIVPIAWGEDKEIMGLRAYTACDYFYEGADTGEIGEAASYAGDEERRKYFADLWEYLTKEILIFKEVI